MRGADEIKVCHVALVKFLLELEAFLWGEHSLGAVVAESYKTGGTGLFYPSDSFSCPHNAAGPPMV
jgi:hypothetical protein